VTFSLRFVVSPGKRRGGGRTDHKIDEFLICIELDILSKQFDLHASKTIGLWGRGGNVHGGGENLENKYER